MSGSRRDPCRCLPGARNNRQRRGGSGEAGSARERASRRAAGERDGGVGGGGGGEAGAARRGAAAALRERCRGAGVGSRTIVTRGDDWRKLHKRTRAAPASPGQAARARTRTAASPTTAAARPAPPGRAIPRPRRLPLHSPARRLLLAVHVARSLWSAAHLQRRGCPPPVSRNTINLTQRSHCAALLAGSRGTAQPLARFQ